MYTIGKRTGIVHALSADSHGFLNQRSGGRFARAAIRLIILVPLAGLEPARCFHHLILSQARLPIPPQGQAIDV